MLDVLSNSFCFDSPLLLLTKQWAICFNFSSDITLSISWWCWIPLASSAVECFITLSVISWRSCCDSSRDLVTDIDCEESKLRNVKVRSVVHGDVLFLDVVVQVDVGGFVLIKLDMRRFPVGRLLRNLSLPLSLMVQPVYILCFCSQSCRLRTYSLWWMPEKWYILGEHPHRNDNLKSSSEVISRAVWQFWIARSNLSKSHSSSLIWSSGAQYDRVTIDSASSKKAQAMFSERLLSKKWLLCFLFVDQNTVSASQGCTGKGREGMHRALYVCILVYRWAGGKEKNGQHVYRSQFLVFVLC